ncbi:MAG: DUF3347 domain-containing protein [Sphingobacteriaceae bacterium]
MRPISKTLMAISMLLSFTFVSAQVKNTKTVSLIIFGNCNICKKTIEKAGNVKKAVNVEWNKDTKMATLTYDAEKTNQAEILKRIALAGYDSEDFLAPDNAYAQLPACCQYERSKTMTAKNETPIEDMSKADHKALDKENKIQDSSQLISLYDNYFAIADALIQTNETKASVNSKVLLSNIEGVKMDKLSADVHGIWMKFRGDLKEDAAHITNAKNTSQQRDHFVRLSKHMYALMKASKMGTPVYYQFCPMANNGKGANWLSKESSIQNPYYGSKMLNCGETVETIND